MYEMKLRKHSYNVETSFDGWTGLRLIQQFKPDVLLIDFHLPSLSGVETLEKLVHHKFHNPRIIMTSNIEHDIVVQESKHLPIDQYLMKVEHTPAEVLEIIRNLIQTSPGRQLA